MKKVGISLPDNQLKAIEKICKKERIPRSRAIQRALDEHLKQLEEAKAVKQYIEGYRRKPQSAGDAEAYSKAAAEVLGYEDWS